MGKFMVQEQAAAGRGRSADVHSRADARQDSGAADGDPQGAGLPVRGKKEELVQRLLEAQDRARRAADPA